MPFLHAHYGSIFKENFYGEVGERCESSKTLNLHLMHNLVTAAEVLNYKLCPVLLLLEGLSVVRLGSVDIVAHQCIRIHKDFLQIYLLCLVLMINLFEGDCILSE